MLFHARARSTPSSDPTRAAERLRMVEQQIRSRDIHHMVVLEAMREVLRHEFVPASCQAAAYDDRPLSIGHGQTISQPYMVAAMTAALDPQPADSVLEIGTGSGYQTAVLAHLARDILSFEWGTRAGRQGARHAQTSRCDKCKDPDGRREPRPAGPEVRRDLGNGGSTSGTVHTARATR